MNLSGKLSSIIGWHSYCPECLSTDIYWDEDEEEGICYTCGHQWGDVDSHRRVVTSDKG